MSFADTVPHCCPPAENEWNETSLVDDLFVALYQLISIITQFNCFQQAVFLPVIFGYPITLWVGGFDLVTCDFHTAHITRLAGDI